MGRQDEKYDHYPIFLKNDWATLHHSIIQLEVSKVFVLTDTNTSKLCLPILKDRLPTRIINITIEAGEPSKNLISAKHIWQSLADNGADRHSVLINLGGGVITDIGAFCAATYMRGIRFIQIPTSVLAMTDAAIGGKTGVDLGHLKNYIGTFSTASSIYIYPDFIQSLQQEEIISGFGEIIKHGILEGRELWKMLNSNTPISQINWEKVLKLSIQVKVDIVSQDRYESGLRKTLNFGHTFGHAFESYSLKHDHNPLKHGNAVALGMICAVLLSENKLQLEHKIATTIISTIRYYCNIPKFKIQTWDALYDIMLKDKKNKKGEVRAVLLQKLGSAVTDQVVTREEFKLAMQSLL